MIIKKGYNDQETTIRISGRDNDRVAEVWIEQTGLASKETLSYVELDELLDLKEEIDEAIKVITKLK